MEFTDLLTGARLTAAAHLDGAPHDDAWVLHGTLDVRHLAPVRRDRRLELEARVVRHGTDVRGRDL
jgi:acyl-coenzyme A thioesterase PaaI-like protein